MTIMSFQYYLLYLTNPTNSTFKKASGDIIIISDTFSFWRHALKSFHSLDRCFRFNEMRSSSLVAVLVGVITLIAIISKWTPTAINVDHIIFWIKAQRNIMIDFPICRFPGEPSHDNLHPCRSSHRSHLHPRFPGWSLGREATRHLCNEKRPIQS